jgi:UDP-glucose 4-epimerase
MNQKEQKTALVTGATGVIGPVLVKRLQSEGYHVRALIRPGSKFSKLPKDIDIRSGDLTDDREVEEAVAGVNVIFHLAAKLHLDRPGPSHKDEYREVNVEGTRRMARAARINDVRRLVFFSTINVYGPSNTGLIYDEDSPIHPDSWYAQTKAQAEDIVLDGVPAVVLRLAAVYGPGMKGNYPRLLEALRKGYFLMIGDGRNRRTLVFIHDVCQAALLAAEHPEAVGQVFNVTDGEIHTLYEVVKVISEALGKRTPRFSLPKGLVRPAFGVIEDGLGLLDRRSPVGRSTVDKMLEDLAVNGVRIKKKLGFKPQYDLQGGWRETVRALSHH